MHTILKSNSFKVAKHQIWKLFNITPLCVRLQTLPGTRLILVARKLKKIVAWGHFSPSSSGQINRDSFTMWSRRKCSTEISFQYVSYIYTLNVLNKLDLFYVYRMPLRAIVRKSDFCARKSRL